MLEEGLILFALQLTDPTKCPKCVLFTLQDQVITTSKALHSKRTRIARVMLLPYMAKRCVVLGPGCVTTRA